MLPEKSVLSVILSTVMGGVASCQQCQISCTRQPFHPMFRVHASVLAVIWAANPQAARSYSADIRPVSRRRTWATQVTTTTRHVGCWLLVGLFVHTSCLQFRSVCWKIQPRLRFSQPGVHNRLQRQVRIIGLQADVLVDQGCIWRGVRGVWPPARGSWPPRKFCRTSLGGRL